MPWGDSSGPRGEGPVTGRGLGYCTGYPSPGFTRGVPRGGAGFGRGPWRPRNWGRGPGFGRGRGFRNRYWRTGYPGWYRQERGYPAYGGWTERPPAEPSDFGPETVPAGRPTREEEIRMLEEEKRTTEQEINYLKRDIEEIQNRIEELKK